MLDLRSCAYVGSSKNLGRAPFRKMPKAGLKIAQKGLKNTFFVKILPRHLVWQGLGRVFRILGGLNPQTPYAHVCSCVDDRFDQLIKEGKNRIQRPVQQIPITHLGPVVRAIFLVRFVVPQAELDEKFINLNIKFMQKRITSKATRN